MGSQMAPTSPALTTSSYGILSPRSETSHPTRARSSTVGSADSSSSFEFANAETASEGYSEESGDEIVWNLPRCHQNEDDDFVVLSRRPEVENVCTPVRKTDKETVAVTPRDSNAQEAPLDDTLASNHGARCSTLPTSSAKPQLRWADEGFDNEDQKSSDGHQGASASNIQSLPTPNVTPKRDVGLGKRYPPLETPPQPSYTAPPSPTDTVLPQLKTKAKKKKSKSKRETQGKNSSNVSGDGVKKGEKKPGGKPAPASEGEHATDAAPIDSSTFQEAQDYISSYVTLYRPSPQRLNLSSQFPIQPRSAKQHSMPPHAPPVSYH
jgi:hypothetical protein